MRLRRLALLAVAALLTGAAPAERAVPDPRSADRIRATVEFLSDDLLEGRDTGSRGHEIAAGYVASKFRELGLRPGGENGGWFVQVPLRRATLASPPRISVTIGGKSVALTIGKDAALRPSLTMRDISIAAPLVFVGRGISDRRLGIDDYAGIDVRGKVVVALADEATTLPSEIASHLRSAQTEVAKEHGAAGFVLVDEPSADLVKRTATRPAVDWIDAQGRTGRAGSSLAEVALSEEWAERLFSRAPHSLRQVRTAALSNRPVPRFVLPATIRIAGRSEWKDFTSPEVVAVLSGSDPKLAREHVVLMAHLDHLGIDRGAKPGEDAIYNGALDNAAGVATMLEAARDFVQSGKPPRRSVMFIANTGEELGLLGAGYFATHPTVPAGDIVGLVDLDMPLLLYDFTDVIAFGADHSTIARTVAAAGAGMRVAVSPDPMPEETLFVRSDHYQFVKRGVPAVFLMTGWGNGGREVWRRFLDRTYHTVKDDLSQPIRWEQGARFADLNYRIARTMADADQRPMWLAGDYFGDTFAPTQPKAVRRP